LPTIRHDTARLPTGNVAVIATHHRRITAIFPTERTSQTTELETATENNDKDKEHNQNANKKNKAHLSAVATTTGARTHAPLHRISRLAHILFRIIFIFHFYIYI
jgi:hypothetical protein